ncbi:uncharacterized protein [Argopecten irradians]|uniref:uncharacterized protein n=1 Tax=Argopecten irradians TaxID=31199 RepID=UPI00371C5E60
MELTRHFGFNRNRGNETVYRTSFVIFVCIFLDLPWWSLASPDCVRSGNVSINRVLSVSEITLRKARQVCDVVSKEVQIFVLDEHENSNVTTVLLCPSIDVPEITIAFQGKVISLTLSKYDGSVNVTSLPSNSVQVHVEPSKSAVLPIVSVKLKRSQRNLNLGRMYAQCGKMLESMENFELRLPKKQIKKRTTVGDRRYFDSERFERDAYNIDRPNITDQAQCGETHSCFRYGKSSCQHMECTYFVSYRVDDIVSRRTIHLEVSGQAQGWLAMGFSSDNKMGGADIIACIRKDVASSEFRAAAFSTSYYHDTPTEKDSFSNLTRYEEADGFFYCYIQVPFKQRSGNYVDLSNDWYQLYAWGNIGAGGKMERHTHQPLTSLTQVSVMYKRNEFGAGIQIKGGNVLLFPLLILTMLLP